MRRELLLLLLLFLLLLLLLLLLLFNQVTIYFGFKGWLCLQMGRELLWCGSSAVENLSGQPWLGCNASAIGCYLCNGGVGGGYLCKRPPSIAALQFVILEARIILQQQRRAMCKCKSTEQWALSILFIFQRKILTYTASLCIIFSASLISPFDPGWFRDAKSWRYWRYISAIFLAGANFWAISAISGHFWAIWGNFGSFLGYFGSFCVIFGPFFGANFVLAKNWSLLFLLLFASLGWRPSINNGGSSVRPRVTWAPLAIMSCGAPLTSEQDNMHADDVTASPDIGLCWKY